MLNGLEITAHRAIEYFGKASQRVKAIEELSELIQALAKDHLYSEGSANGEIYGHRIWHNLLDEIADCTIMLAQLRIIYGSEDVDRRISYKLDQLANRISDQT